MRDLEDLHLHEQLMLLALRDEKGTLERKASMHGFALGGALLAELSLRGRIRIGEGKPLVDWVDGATLGEPVLDECVRMIATAKRRAKAATWVHRFANMKRLRHRVAEGLCRRGILRDDEDKVLLFFTRKLYPTINPGPERRLVDRLRTAVFSDASRPDPDTALVAALAHAAGMLPIHFDKKDLKRRKKHLERITEGTTAGTATQQAIRAVEQAVVAAVISASAASVAVTSG